MNNNVIQITCSFVSLRKTFVLIALKEKQIKSVEHKLLPKISGPKMNLNNNDLCTSPSIVRTVKYRYTGRDRNSDGETVNAYRILMEKSLGKLPLRRPRTTWAHKFF
jgi:hypothetical protein